MAWYLVKHRDNFTFCLFHLTSTFQLRFYGAKCDGNVITNSEQLKMWMEIVMTFIKVLYPYSHDQENLIQCSQ